MTDQIFLFVQKHFVLLAVSYVVFMAAVGAMEPPNEKSSAFYGWTFRFLNGLAINLDRAAHGRSFNNSNQEALPDERVGESRGVL
jgi:hypothetical protein